MQFKICSLGPKKFARTISIGLAAASTLASISVRADDFECQIPQTSQWNWSEQKLAQQTKVIVVAKALRSVHSGKVPSIKSDFKVAGGIGVHGRANAEASEDMWATTQTTFEVSEALKGQKPKGDRFNLIAMDASDEAPEKKLTSLLCDLRLKFEVGSIYLIFLNSFNANGYQRIDGVNDPKVEVVRRMLKTR